MDQKVIYNILFLIYYNKCLKFLHYSSAGEHRALTKSRHLTLFWAQPFTPIHVFSWIFCFPSDGSTPSFSWPSWSTRALSSPRLVWLGRHCLFVECGQSISIFYAECKLPFLQSSLFAKVSRLKLFDFLIFKIWRRLLFTKTWILPTILFVTFHVS